MHLTLPVSEGLSAVGDARRVIAAQLRDWGVLSVLDSAELVVSELVTNARLHTTGPIEVAITAIESGVRIEVKDGAAHIEPSPQNPTTEDTSGRGLTIVNALSADWGVDRDDVANIKTVWAEISIID